MTDDSIFLVLGLVAKRLTHPVQMLTGYFSEMNTSINDVVVTGKVFTS